MEIGLGECGELRAFHADVGAFAVDGYSAVNAGVGQDCAKIGAGGMRERYVGYQAVAEEGRDAAFSAVEELVGDEELAGAEFFFQGAYGAHGDDSLHAE